MKAASQTCIVVTVRDQGGAGVANVMVTRDGGNAKATDASGTVLWCVSVSQTSSRLTVDGTIVSARASGGTASLRDNTVHVAWLKGTDPVAVSITAQASGETPTPSSTPAPTWTPRPTATLGPSPTPLPTPTTWDGWYDASAIIEVEPANPPGRYTFRVIDGGGVAVTMQTHEGGDYPTGCGPDCTSAFGWMRLFFECDYTCPKCPPMPTVMVVTATPGPTDAAPQPTPATGPTLTLDQDLERCMDRVEAETGIRPWLIWVSQIEGPVREFVQSMQELSPGRPYFVWWSH